MAILDAFDRATLGANWESPALGTNKGDNPLAMISGQDGIEEGAGGGIYSSGIYIGQEFTYNKQYAQLEWLVDYSFEDYAAYIDEFAGIGLILNVSKTATGVERSVQFDMWPTMTSYYYRTIYTGLIYTDDAGATGFLSGGWYDPDRHFTAERIPAGTKLRLERVGDWYYGLIWSPDIGYWQLLASARYSAIKDGYPGVRIFASNNGTAASTNFRAGSSEDDFLVQGPSYKPGNQDTSGNRNKRESRFWYPGANDVTYRLGDNDKPSVGTFDNKSRNRFS